MVYFVFDLDLTLADISDEEYTRLDTIYDSPVHNRLAQYTDFVESIAEQEIYRGTNTSGTYNGLLRPTTLIFMKQIYTLYKQGLCQGVILYSNNRDLRNLHFVRDIILSCLYDSLGNSEEIYLEKFFCLCIHRLYPGRPQTTDNPPKTWTELQSIMLNNKEACGIVDNRLSPSDIYFFDDMTPVHAIVKELPSNQYVKVLPYQRGHVTYEQIFRADQSTVQKAITTVASDSVSIPIGGYYYRHTLKNRIQQKKQQRKHKYSRKHKNRKNKGKKEKV